MYVCVLGGLGEGASGEGYIVALTPILMHFNSNKAHLHYWWLHMFKKAKGKIFYLVVTFNRFGERMMNYKANIRFVDTCNNHVSLWFLQSIKINKNQHTHSKSHCSANYINFIFAPLLLNVGTLCRIHVTVVKRCFMPTFLFTEALSWEKIN